MQSLISRHLLLRLGAFVSFLLASTRGVWAEPELQDNIVVILDASGSMETKMREGGMSRMEAAKTALLQVMKTVPPSSNVGLLVFSAKNMKSGWAYQLGPVDSAKLEAAIRLPQPGGDTPLGAFLKLGADSLLSARQKQRGYGTFRLLAVTDGEATDKALVEKHLPQILARGVTLDVIGVDMKSDLALATKVHSYQRANDPEALNRAVSKVFAEIPAAQGDQTGAELFDLIAPLPDKIAVASLAALTMQSNEPIGGKPREAKASPARKAAPAATPQTNPQPPKPTPPKATPPSPPPPPASAKGKSSSWSFWVPVIFLIAVALLSRSRSGRRRN